MTPFLETKGINLPAIAADIYCLYLVIILTASFYKHYLFLSYPPTVIYPRLRKIIHRIPVPDIGNMGTLISHIILIILLLTAVFAEGWINRLCLAAAIIAYFAAFSKVEGLETNRRKTFLIPIYLFIFLMSPAISSPWNSDGSYWPIWALKLALCQIYVSAAFQKIRHNEVSWISQNSFRIHLQRLSLFESLPAAQWLLHYPRLCRLMSSFVMVIQASFWLILILPWVTPIYFIAGLIFHIGTIIFMKIYYLKYIAGAYAILLIDSLYWWIPTKQLEAWFV